jgi:hypothetical protein
MYQPRILPDHVAGWVAYPHVMIAITCPREPSQAAKIETRGSGANAIRQIPGLSYKE